MASVGSSLLFGVVFFLAPLLEPLDANHLLAWRLVTIIPSIAIIFTLLRQWKDVGRLFSLIHTKPILMLVLIIDGALLGIQLWLFGWAPQTGHGLDLALGFLLLPLAMVLVGVLLNGERLSKVRIIAVSFALIGVVAAVFLAHGIGWTTIIVVIGYPIYFIIRRHFQMNSVGATALEFVVMTPFAIFILLQPGSVTPVVTDFRLGLLVIALGAVSAAGFLSYLQASRILPFGLFGLLGYLEPILLILIAILLLGEPFSIDELLVYGPIMIAIILLTSEGFLSNSSRHQIFVKKKLTKRGNLEGENLLRPSIDNEGEAQVAIENSAKFHATKESNTAK